MFIPNFIAVQRDSFNDLLEKGIIKEILTRNCISNTTNDLELSFYPQYYKLTPPDFNSKQAILKSKTYACKLYIPAQLINNKTKEIKIQWVLLGNLPLMTKRGHFIINGAPRIIINQMIRSPGIYYQQIIDKDKKRTYYADLISYRGTWLRLETDKKKAIWARMKKTPKISILLLLQAMGLTKQTIFQSIQNSNYLMNSFLKENHPITTKQALLLLYSETHPKKDKSLLTSTMGKKFLFRKFMNPKTYDLSDIGRLKINQKLGLSVSSNQTTLTPQDILSATDYLIKLEYGSGEIDDIDNLKNRRVRASGEIIQNQFSLGLIRLEKVIREKLKKNRKNLNLKGLITTKPINGALKEFFGSSQLSQFMDQTNPLAEITHKRRITSVGPGGVSRETAGMAVRGIHSTHYGRICPIETPEGPNAGLVNSITSMSRINKIGFLETPFFKVYKGQVQNSLNPLFLTAHQEENIIVAPSDLPISKLSFLPSKKIPSRLGKDFKQINHNNINYIAISQIQMISIATSLIPFLEHDDANRALMGSNMQRQAVPLMTSERPIVGTGLEGRIIADTGYGVQSIADGYISYISGGKIILQKQLLSSINMNTSHTFEPISPFEKSSFSSFLFSRKYNSCSHSTNEFQHSNFYQKNSLVELQEQKKMFIPSRFRGKKSCLLKNNNQITKHTNHGIRVNNLVNSAFSFQKTEIILENYQRSNQETCLTQRPVVTEGDWVQKGDLLADGTASVKGELSLGKNVLIAYMPWEGYNFEDAVLISERLVYDDVYTSIHIERFEVEIRDTKFGLEQITNKIPEIDAFDLLHLDETGIAKTGSWVKEGDILVGKVTPIHKKPLSPHEKLLYDIVGKEIPTTRDTSLRVPKGVHGRVIQVQLLDTQTLPPETPFEGPGRVHIYIAEKRKIQVGDKIAGRHGNKGIVSKILPRQDMPYLPDGTPIDIVLNPLGVPSRMNVGQVFECLLGLAGVQLKEQYKLMPFDETFGPEASRSLVYTKLYSARLKTKKDWLFNPNYPGKMKIFNGATGNPFDQYITVGQAYILKLVHLVDEKIHARSTGPYSLVTQQPLRGRSKHGGQRLGEMEVWALEGFGAAYTLQELLTIKSDDIKGRYQVLDSILKKKPIFLGTPESFKVLVRELQSLCLDVRVYGFDATGIKKQIDVLKLS